ncbi:hypothetical protein VNO77_20283 [Canavalia gladiata]|uniref:Uncharacterized protein n=1 Tax=Canavalia gladiata TaxID=3824 RepID=A0AAN9QJ80_CANGL
MLVVEIREPEEQNSEAEHAIEIKYFGEEEENIENIVLEDKKLAIDEFLIGERIQEEEVVEEPNWVLSTEELNKKFDNFIRRMKEDLRNIAERQLLMVEFDYKQL